MGPYTTCTGCTAFCKRFGGGIRKDVGSGRRLRKRLAKALRKHRASIGAADVRTCYATWGRHYVERYGE